MLFHFFTAIFTLFMSLLLYLWTLPFCSSGSCLGFGRYIFHFIIALYQDKIVIIHFSCRYLAAFYQLWDSIQRMKSCTLFHSWLVLWHGHRSFKLTPLYSLMRFRIKKIYLVVKIIWFLWYSDADHWFAIFFVLNFRDRVSAWVQQSMSYFQQHLVLCLTFSLLHVD